METEGWQTVQRRRRARNSQAASSSLPKSPTLARGLVLYGDKPTYARALSSNLPKAAPTNPSPAQGPAPTNPGPVVLAPHPSLATATNPSRSNLPTSHRHPPQPRRPRQPKLITSPDSPTTLKFPPTNEDPDWRNRCFRCFRLGHQAAKCENPRRCASCWDQDHSYHDCPGPKQEWRRVPQPSRATGTRGRHQPSRRTNAPQHANPPPKAPRQHPPSFAPLQNPMDVSSQEAQGPRRPSNNLSSLQEPDFLDLLTANHLGCHTVPPDSERPARMSCYIARDAKFVAEVGRLSKGFVISQPKNAELDMTVDEVAKMVAGTGLVTPQQLQVGSLGRGTYLVLPPEGTDAYEICLAFPEEWWIRGFQASLWSPWIEAEVNIPRFKVWIEFLGLKPQLWREDFVASWGVWYLLGHHYPRRGRKPGTMGSGNCSA